MIQSFKDTVDMATFTIPTLTIGQILEEEFLQANINLRNRKPLMEPELEKIHPLAVST